MPAPIAPVNPRTLPLLEVMVPVVSFGGAFLALFASSLGSTIDVRYFGTGCVIASIILAYLAWIRPHKDIVAMTMPIYSVLFFLVPSDLSVDVFLILLYAASLTVLLIRLKRRFGSGNIQDTGELGGPLAAYCDRVFPRLAGTDAGIAHNAAVVFLRFSRGEYAHAATEASLALSNSEPDGTDPALLAAFAIAREQALLLESSTEHPERFLEFAPSMFSSLAKISHESEAADERFETMLDNALLLLFCAGWIASENDRDSLRTGKGFAEKLIS